MHIIGLQESNFQYAMQDEVNGQVPSVRRGASMSSGAESVSGRGRRARRRGAGDAAGEAGDAADDESGRSEPATSLMPGSAPPPPHQSEQSQW